MAHRTPVVEQGVLVLESGDGPTGIVVDTPAWFAWLASATKPSAEGSSELSRAARAAVTPTRR